MSGIDIDPEYLCVAVDRMGWADLQRVARAVLAGFQLVAEAPGAQLRETMIARSKSSGSAPRSTPVCKCGCPSQRDHWQQELDAAADRDVARAFDGEAAVDPEPRAFRSVVFRAAEELHATATAPGREKTPHDPADPDMASADLADFICERYRGVPADRVAVLETRRRGRGFVSTAAIRRIRSSNSYGMELGEPLPADEHLIDDVLIEHRKGKSDREIARDLDIGRKAIASILEGRRTVLAPEAA